MSNVTRISDLPTGGNTENLQNVMVKEQATNYVPINVHPNPYGISDKNPIEHEPPNPISTQIEQQPKVDYTNIVAQQQLPSRDIPMDNTQYTQDPEVQANYVPPGPPDYLKNYELEEKKNLEYEQQQHRNKMANKAMDEIQLAVFVGFLFFLFQTSFFRKLIWNHFTWLPILNSDGNLNGYGILFKSSIFALCFYLSQKLTEGLMII
tara:strand:+ start:392 stop:1012 length:621 start_codon:yes stop_codon:yes gene_type:complete